MTLGYREARLASNCALGAAGQVLRGHEFHYATIVAAGRDEPFAFVRDAYGAPAAPRAREEAASQARSSISSLKGEASARSCLAPFTLLTETDSPEE